MAKRREAYKKRSEEKRGKSSQYSSEYDRKGMLQESIEERERRLQKLKRTSKEKIEAETAEQRVNG